MFNPWPAFNLADSAISVGVIVLLIETLFDKGGRPADSG
jgi:signal peptidase II